MSDDNSEWSDVTIPEKVDFEVEGGEYVVNAKTVAKKGTDFFDKLNEEGLKT